ncbi:hypothetical protein F441_18801 [Phytophthora nicotianae CJ01A1]|uniref:Uncharacterized protein n=3 Tax=Phytophthora nicotianae TaxID=4792 RepID=W2QYD9_PHYN3|nr:hypothetical protein PPTG_21635 [Phytophthora nicotianae INRA-310]ETK74857.1 hypothetical protein L915_18420 [Phytophthora nicotianae]ETP04402.1 hypothetical protein F441_18801 [Phytophthora nicotianae CJ01A1]ETK74864.1 hypothetical protein L915_18419 [Phytophthora nicotianae]ETL28287.1 hypothetical protein L916_18321 [Phytophthora nicotianae]ETM34739.1 hypothetical protein L914_18229 [Phytophthora nicotianae]
MGTPSPEQQRPVQSSADFRLYGGPKALEYSSIGSKLLQMATSSV